MALSVAGKGGNGATNGANITLTFSTFSYTALQDDIIILMGGFGSATSGAAGPSTAGYTQIALYDGHAGDKTVFGAWYKVMGSTPDTSVVGLGSGNANDGVVYCFYGIRGANTSSPFDATSTTAGPTTSTNPDGASITTNTANTLVIVAAGNGVSDGTPGTPSGYSNLIQNNGNDTNPFSAAMASIAFVGPGTENPPVYPTWSSGTWYAITMAISDATAGGSTTPVSNLLLMGVG